MASHSGIWMFRTVRTSCVTERHSSLTSLLLKEKSMRLLRNVRRYPSNNATSYPGILTFSEAGMWKPKISQDLCSFQKPNAINLGPFGYKNKVLCIRRLWYCNNLTLFAVSVNAEKHLFGDSIPKHLFFDQNWNFFNWKSVNDTYSSNFSTVSKSWKSFWFSLIPGYRKRNS